MESKGQISLCRVTKVNFNVKKVKITNSHLKKDWFEIS